MSLSIPKGLEIHHGKIRISFMYNGKRQRVSLMDLAINQASIDYAEKVRILVLEEIKRGVFDFNRRFPDYKKPRNTSTHKEAEKTLPSIRIEEVKPITVTEGVHIWLGVMQGETAKTTYTNYRSKANNIIKHFGDKPLESITIQDLRMFRNHLVKPNDGSKGLATKTVNDILTIIRGVWADAKANNLISHNHMLDISNHKVKHKSTADPFNRNEIKRILHADYERMPEARMVAFNCWTGLSRSELLGLALEDIDLANNLIYVKRACVEDEFRIPKEIRRERIVELIKPAEMLLREILKDAQLYPTQTITITQRDNLTTETESVTLLFRNGATGNPWRSDDLDKWFIGHLEKANVRYRGINQCRHTFASQALSSHVNMEWIAKQLGHADTTMIKKHYGKFMPKDAQRLANQVSEQMGFG